MGVPKNDCVVFYLHEEFSIFRTIVLKQILNVIMHHFMKFIFIWWLRCLQRQLFSGCLAQCLVGTRRCALHQTFISASFCSDYVVVMNWHGHLIDFNSRFRPCYLGGNSWSIAGSTVGLANVFIIIVALQANCLFNAFSMSCLTFEIVFVNKQLACIQAWANACICRFARTCGNFN
jgi:hypothetical protein